MQDESARAGGVVVTSGLPMICHATPERLVGINAADAANEFPLCDAHTLRVEGSGLKNASYRHLACETRADFKKLLDLAKPAVWENAKAVSPKQIEANGRPASHLGYYR